MSSTVVGTATVYALDGVTIAYTSPSTVAGDIEPTNLALEATHASSELTDKSGQILSAAYTGRKQTLTVTLFHKAPAAGSNTRALAAAAWKEPDVATKVTLAGFGNAMIDGDWNYDGQFSPTFSATGFGSATIRLARRGQTISGGTGANSGFLSVVT